MSEIPTEIRVLNLSHFEAVKRLYREFKKEVGFFPDGALREYLENEGCSGVLDSQGALLAYVMFKVTGDRVRIAQLCVDKRKQGKGVAKELVLHLIEVFSSKLYIQLKCRRDFAAHGFWTRMGFVVHNEEPGRSEKGHVLSHFYYRLAKEKDLDLELWMDVVADDRTPVAIDAQIFFDIFAMDESKSIPAKNLLSGYVDQSFQLFITDETLAEIGRNQDDAARKVSRDRARGFDTLSHDHVRAREYEEKLSTILPYGNENQISDVRQLAKAAASDAEFFVTRDEPLYKKRREIEGVTGLVLYRPGEFFVSQHENSGAADYSPKTIAGLNMRWQRLTSSLLKSVDLGVFTAEGESSARIRGKIEAAVGQPDSFAAEVLQASDVPVGLRLIDHTDVNEIRVPVLRVSREASNDSVYRVFVLADSIREAAARNAHIVSISDEFVEDRFNQVMGNMGFVKIDGFPTRFILPRMVGRNEVIRLLNSWKSHDFQRLPDAELEKMCGPLQIQESTPFFIVSIQPNFARQMLDDQAAMEDLFAEKAQVFLRADNVYYRTFSHQHMLKFPARIFWYVSGSVGQIIAVSRLDEIVNGEPKKLFSMFRKFGVLEWPDIYKICGKDVTNPIMALRFSETYPLSNRVSYSEMRDLLAKFGKSPSLPSPMNISYDIAHSIFNLGFPENGINS